MSFNKLFKNSILIAAKDNDFKPKNISYSEALVLNKNKFSIFFTVQGFTSGRRITENLSNINAWAIDIDKDSKEQQLERIRNTALVPSLVVESKNGFHVYWMAKDATKQNFPKVMYLLVNKFLADANAKDLCRVLRMPGFFHWKDENDPYKVETIFKSEKYYTEKEMLFFFAEKKTESKKTEFKKLNFENVNNKQALSALSGTSHVRGDTIEFKPNSNGTEQIWVNGKSTACWLDKNGLIGSHSKGGPGVWNWINFYYNDRNETTKIVRELFSK
jgi:hypothetical protein